MENESSTDWIKPLEMRHHPARGAVPLAGDVVANNASSAGAAGEWRAGGSIHSLIRRRLWPPAK